MKRFTGKLLAILLAVSMFIGSVVCVSASKPAELPAQANDALLKILDGVLDTLSDALFSTIGNLFKAKDIPTLDEYNAAEHDNFYEGTDGSVNGNGWKLGYAGTSVIPSQWRENAAGESDPNGYCLNKSYYFGGYFTAKVDKIYDDECVNLVVMTTGSDSNNNGVEDIIIFAALDGIGFSNENVRAVRADTEVALAAKGVTADDIIAFNFNSTHAHSVIDPQGMGLDLFIPLVKNRLLGTTDRSAQPELIACIRANTAKAAVEAYEKMESGALYYFESEDVSEYSSTYKVVGDKRNQGTKCQSNFGCFLFESVSGEKTVISSIGMHPTKAGRGSMKVCADVPHYIGEAMNEAGYNFVFIQGAQGAVSLSTVFSEAGDEWANTHTLSYDEWVSRYGEDYAAANYANTEDGLDEGEYHDIRASGYTIAHLIIEAIDRSSPVAPVLDVKMGTTVIPLDYGIMWLGAVSNLLGFNTVEYDDSESSYAIVVEIGYVGLGNDVAFVVMPGEISPALVYGSDDRFTGDKSWEGPTSWSGENWELKTIESYVREATGDADKTVLSMGLANDAIGYVFPDTDMCCFLMDSFSLVDDHYEELLITGKQAGSSMVKGFIELLSED